MNAKPRKAVTLGSYLDRAFDYRGSSGVIGHTSQLRRSGLRRILSGCLGVECCRDRGPLCGIHPLRDLHFDCKRSQSGQRSRWGQLIECQLSDFLGLKAACLETAPVRPLLMMTGTAELTDLMTSKTRNDLSKFAFCASKVA